MNPSKLTNLNNLMGGLSGAASGAALGTMVMPGIGTAVGAGVGGSMPLVDGMMAQDPQQQNMFPQMAASQQQLNASMMQKSPLSEHLTSVGRRYMPEENNYYS